MAFFRNRAVNRANLHYGIQAFAEAGGGVFIFVYLLRAGVSVPATLTVLAALLAYGGAMALAALVGAACGLLLGRHIDAGYGRRAVLIAYAATAVVVLLRAASVGSPWLAVSANAAGAFSSALLMPAMMTALYNLAKASPCPLRFHIVTEGAWDIGCGGACLIAAGFAQAGLPLSTAILLAILAAGAAAALLCRYYDRVSAPATPDPSG